MLLGIFSDTHDRIVNIDIALEYFKKHDITTLLHAGDVSSVETLEYIAKKFHGDIYVVEGNSDLDPTELKALAEIYPKLHYEYSFENLVFDDVKVGMIHKPSDIKKIKDKESLDVIIHGHTHKPWQHFEEGVEILSSGNLSDILYPATLAIYNTDTKKPSLIQLARIVQTDERN